MIDKKYLGWYFPIYNFIARERIIHGDVDVREIHKTICAVLITGILMWGYGLLALFTMTSPTAGYVGLSCALIHCFSPLLYRFTNNSFLITNVLVGSGIIHQSCFSWYSGGFYSPTFKWFGIMPLIGGFIVGVRGALTWFVVSSIVSAAFFYLKLHNYPFLDIISPRGQLISTCMIQFGYIYLSTIMIIHFGLLNQTQERVLSEQSQKISDLFRVLIHDLSSPLQRIGMGLSVTKRQQNDPATERGVEIISKAHDSMVEITQNIRRMYTLNKEMSNLELSSLSVLEAVSHVDKLFSEDLKNKGLRLVYDESRLKHVNVLVEPVSFKNQVLANILHNAIKFSHPGGMIQIKVTPNQKESIDLEIIDSGIGIPKELLPGLFDANAKVTRKGTSGEAGSGLGMKIIKSFVELYGGKIFVESEQGTTVKLQLKIK